MSCTVCLPQVVYPFWCITYSIAWVITVFVQAQSRALKGITDHALEGLQRKSYRFYSNVFTGGLVAKVKRFVRAFEELTDQIVFQM